MTGSDGMWPFARRFLSFDEPSVKDAQLSKLHNSFPGGQQQSIAADQIDAIIKARTTNDLLFSAAFALEDAKRFTNISFAAWAHANRSTAPIETIAIDPRLQEAILALGEQLGLSKEACQWCTRISTLGIPWHMLQDSDVIHTQFIKDALNRISRARNDSIFTVDDLRSSHRALLDAVKHLRRTLPSNILPRAILIVEGSTEAILIPHITDLLGYSLAEKSVMLVAAGGAKQVSKRFLQMRDIVTIPMFCLLDADAQEQSELITDALRSNDQLHVLHDGEIEDTFAEQFFTRVLNQYLQANLVSGEPVMASEFARGTSPRKRTAIAQTVLRRRASIDFDKVEFARLTLEYLRAPDDVPKELRAIVDTIMPSLH